MNKPRPAGSVEAAIVRIYQRLGASVVAEVLGVTAGQIRKLSDPDHPTTINARQMLILDKTYACVNGGETPITDAIKDLVARALNNVVPQECPRTLVLRAVGEMGDVARTVEEGLGDGKLTPQEKRKMAKETHEAIDALRSVLKRVEGK